MTYLITGATGFLGKKLINVLLARGDSVNYMGRTQSKHLDPRAAYHPWNGKDTPPMNSVPRVDAVVHLMGEPIAQRWNAAVKQRIRESRIESTRQLVSGIARLPHKPATLVCASAIGYYGNRGNEVLTESSGAGSGFLAEVCRDWEAEALRARDSGLRVATVRTATVLGMEGGALPRMLTPFRLGLGGKFGDGKHWMSWIHVDDLIRLFRFAAENENASGALNGSSPHPVTNSAFTRTLARAVHRPAVFPVPKFALELAFGEMANFLFDSVRVIPQATEQAGFTFNHPELDEALTELLAR
ncbi:MAG TPA: TIGR01777 family oxidoreductase [Bryobacteraceae bacterium]|nr:TIGR01777 family oxidoreductase [Bryobacteraceae bacterium]